MGVAAICILFYHSTMERNIGRAFCYDFFYRTGVVYSVLYFLTRLLNVGVEVFLFVSAIGLYYSYEKNPRFKDYYIKRIVNVYIIAVIISLIFRSVPNILAGKFDVFNYIISTFSLKWLLGESTEYWYVSFIMILYLVFPLLYKLIKRIEGKKYDKLILTCLIALYMQLLWCAKDTTFVKTYEIGLTRVPIFVVGCYAGYLVKNKKNTSWEIYVFALIGIIMKISFALKGYTNFIYTRFSSFFFVFFVMLLAIYLFKIFPVFIMKFFSFMGNMSLELYLVHGIFYVFCMDCISQYCNVRTYIITVLLTVPIAFIMFKLRKFLVKKYNNHYKSDLNDSKSNGTLN